jgi:hypothetical protein
MTVIFFNDFQSIFLSFILFHLLLQEIWSLSHKDPPGDLQGFGQTSQSQKSFFTPSYLLWGPLLSYCLFLGPASHGELPSPATQQNQHSVGFYLLSLSDQWTIGMLLTTEAMMDLGCGNARSSTSWIRILRFGARYLMSLMGSYSLLVRHLASLSASMARNVT